MGIHYKNIAAASNRFLANMFNITSAHKGQDYSFANNKFLKWLNSSGTAVSAVGLDSSNNLKVGAPIAVGVDDSGHDVTFYGATASAKAQWDESADALLVAGDARIDLSSATVKAANTDGGVIKCGTSGARVTEDTANMKFMSFYFDNGATSGDNRGMYLRQYLTGAGGGGEALRVFTTVEDVAGGTAHGAHVSLNFGSTGSITGQGIGMRGTLHVPDAALTGGTYAAVQAEIYCDGSSSDISGTTRHSLFRGIVDGDGTGKATVTNFLDLTCTAGAGKMFHTATDTTISHKIKVNVNGTDYFLALTAAV